MRTTITFDDDVAAAIARMQREQGVGVSAAVNQLVRSGLVGRRARRPFRQQTSPMRSRIDVTNVAEAIEILDGPAAP
ncbi:MAG: CopG family transcriptional regulator [Acidimicrobiales bacterium]